MNKIYFFSLFILLNFTNIFSQMPLFEEEVKVYSVKDEQKYDPENKAKKARPGMPGIYIE